MDCGVDTYATEEYYMLHDHLWRLSNPAVDGKLCLNCAEQRLGRPLTRSDFADVRVNAGQARVCPALARRLAAAP
jgi:hypothetical protein